MCCGVFSTFSTMAEMGDADPEMALRKLTQTFGVTSHVILNKNGIPVQFFGMEERRANHMAGIFSELVLTCQRFLKNDKQYIDVDLSLDEELDLVCLRLRSYKNEYIICPEENYTLIVVHNPNWVQPEVTAEAVTEEQGEEED
jgi:hypothetical protein